MKKIFIIILLLISQTCYATTMRLPFRCYESVLIEEFVKEGINLDKEDYNSDGFIENCGSYYKIHTYKNVNEDIYKYIEVPRRVSKMMEATNGYRN